ncbi:MAG TPA: NSE2 family E3 SUMO-protein ligase [Chlamydiales bacterium]
MNTITTQLGTDFQSKAKRGAQFANEHPTTALKVPLSGALGVAIGAGAGMGAGALLSVVTPIPAPFSMKAGGALGAAILGALAIKHQIVVIHESAIYETWKKERTQEVNDVFRRYLEENQLEEFFCPITLELIVTPVYHTHDNKHVFERSEILKLIQQQGNKAVCPCCRKPIQKEDLILDLEYHKRVLPLLPLSPQQKLVLPQPKKASPAPIEIRVQAPSAATPAATSPTSTPNKIAVSKTIAAG